MVVVKKSVSISRNLQPIFFNPRKQWVLWFPYLSCALRKMEQETSWCRKVKDMHAYGSSNSCARVVHQEIQWYPCVEVCAMM